MQFSERESRITKGKVLSKEIVLSKERSLIERERTNFKRVWSRRKNCIKRRIVEKKRLKGRTE